MLIVTSHLRDLPGRAGALAQWPGPHLLVLHPGHDLTDTDLNDLEQVFFIYDLADEEPCNLSILRTVLLHSAARSRAPDGPFLFVHDNLTGKDMTRLLRETRGAGGLLRYEGADTADDIADGAHDLTLLLMSADVAENPLVMTFFRNMEPDLGPEHSRASLDMLQEHI